VGPSTTGDGSFAVYDNENEQILKIYYSDGSLWAYKTCNNSWKKIARGENLLCRIPEGFVFDSNNDTLILFGGNLYPGPNTIPCSSDLWVYKLRPFESDGTYSSLPIDLGGIAFFGNISWQASGTANTELAFQVRTSNSSVALNSSPFLGPNGSTTSFYDTSGQIINKIHNGSRWLQYRAYLNTKDTQETPILSSVTIQYNLLQNISIISPIDRENWTGVQKITWTAYDNDNDTLVFDIYLDSGTNSILLAGGLSNDTREWTWNTSAIPNGTYRIKMVARDDNPSIPLVGNTTSGDITIYHPPPPNHPPHIELVSPANNSVVNSTSVLLLWNGTDLDGDRLTYICQYSDDPQLEGIIKSNVTRVEFLDLFNLTENTTYYWTVNADDGIINQTDVPTEIWCFTVKLPSLPINHPPRITSIPPSIVMVGDDFEYNITALDEDNDNITFSTDRAPNNISINSSNGKMRWIPATTDIGNHTVVVKASDGLGGIDEQTFTITVIARPLPIRPLCKITFPANGSRVSGNIKVTGIAINGTDPLNAIRIRIDNGGWSKATGLENWSFMFELSKLKNGKHIIEAQAFDGTLYSDSASLTVNVQNPELKTWIDNPTWWLSLILILAVIISMLILVRRSGGNKPKDLEEL
jgi:hypothetical protein